MRSAIYHSAGEGNMANTPRRPSANGRGVDASGNLAFDPTENVIALVQANKERADDLRKADRTLAKTELKAIRREAVLRTWHNKEMRKLESSRLDAIRNVDVAARVTDQKTALDAIQALAAQTESNRNSLSKQVTDTAETLSKQNAEANKQQLDRIAALEKTSYTGAGEKAVADPAMVQLVDVVTKLVANSSERRGGGAAVVGMKEAVLFAIAIGSFLFALLK